MPRHSTRVLRRRPSNDLLDEIEDAELDPEDEEDDEKDDPDLDD